MHTCSGEGQGKRQRLGPVVVILATMWFLAVGMTLPRLLVLTTSAQQWRLILGVSPSVCRGMHCWSCR